MIKPVFDGALPREAQKHFTRRHHDDVHALSLPIDTKFQHTARRRSSGDVLGLGSDGPREKVVRQINRRGTGPLAQGYFVTTQEVGAGYRLPPRFGPQADPVAYLVEGADSCLHPVRLLERTRSSIRQARRHVLPNSPYGPDEGLGSAAKKASSSSSTRRRLWVIDAFAVAEEVGMGNRINTVMQPCFFHLSRRPCPPTRRSPRSRVHREDLRQAAPGRRSTANFAAIDMSIGRMAT